MAMKIKKQYSLNWNCHEQSLEMLSKRFYMFFVIFQSPVEKILPQTMGNGHEINDGRNSDFPRKNSHLRRRKFT